MDKSYSLTTPRRNKDTPGRQQLAILKENAKLEYIKNLKEIENQYGENGNICAELKMKLKQEFYDLINYLENEYAANLNIAPPKIKRKKHKRYIQLENGETPKPETNLRQLPQTRDLPVHFKKQTYKSSGTSNKKQQIHHLIHKNINNLTFNVESVKKYTKRNLEIEFEITKNLTNDPDDLQETCQFLKDEYESKINFLTSIPRKYVNDVERTRNDISDDDEFLEMVEFLKDEYNEEIENFKNDEKNMSKKRNETQMEKSKGQTQIKTPHKRFEPPASSTQFKGPEQNIAQNIAQKTQKSTPDGARDKQNILLNLDAYQQRLENEHITKVKSAQQTMPTEELNKYIDNLKENLQDKLDQIKTISEKKNQLDNEYAQLLQNKQKELSNQPEELEKQLTILKQDCAIKSNQLIQEFLQAEYPQSQSNYSKLKLSKPKYNLQKLKDRINKEYDEKIRSAKQSMPENEQKNQYITNLEKEQQFKLHKIERLPQIAKKLESEYDETIKMASNSMHHNPEELEDHLEFLKHEYESKIANLDEDSPQLKFKNNNKKLYEHQKSSARKTPNIQVNEIKKPPDNIIIQKDKILANLELAQKNTKNNKQILKDTIDKSMQAKLAQETTQNIPKLNKSLARRQLMDAARSRTTKTGSELKEMSKQHAKVNKEPMAGISALRNEGADDIFRMMLLENKAVDKKPNDIFEFLMKTNNPQLEVVGNALDLAPNEIVPIQIPTRELNLVNTLQTEENFKLNQQKIPMVGLASETTGAGTPIKINLNKTPQSDVGKNISVCLNSYKYETIFQVRGTTLPKWFPGYYTCGPNEDCTEVYVRQSPSDVLMKAWDAMQPKRL